MSRVLLLTSSLSFVNSQFLRHVLYMGDCYLFVATELGPPETVHHLHYWVGKDCPQDAKTAVAFRSIELKGMAFMYAQKRQLRMKRL